MEKILDRFLRYVSVDTQSNEESESQPSTAKQLNLLRMLCAELNAMGVEATLDEFGYVMGSIPSNVEAKVPAIGFIAHVDTAPDASGADIKPQIVENYDGGEIALKGVPGLALKPSEFPEMLHYVGQTLITTDGTTLLGADDKGGVAEIMDAVQYIMAHPEFKHGPIKIGFTPDEEIGRGVVKFDVPRFGADYAYTMDGGEIGELEFENFNAASAKIHIQGRNVHPGYAKGKMKNALHIGQELCALLPVDQRPEYTEGYEGFFHLIAFNGAVEEADIAYIIRDHDRAKFEAKKVMMGQAVEVLQHARAGGTALFRGGESSEGDGNGRHPGEGPAHPRRHRRREPLLQGSPLPEHLRRRVEFPRKDGVRPFGEHGSRVEGHPEHHFPLHGVGFPHLGNNPYLCSPFRPFADRPSPWW